jgi:hypothetical protein
MHDGGGMVGIPEDRSGLARRRPSDLLRLAVDDVRDLGMNVPDPTEAGVRVIHHGRRQSPELIT